MNDNSNGFFKRHPEMAGVLLFFAVTIIAIVILAINDISSSSSSSSSYSSYTSGGCPYTYSDGSRCGREVGKGDTYCSYHTVKKYVHDKKQEDNSNFR